MIDTVLGPKDESTLECDVVAFDGPAYYAYERRYRESGKSDVIARYHDVKWLKQNEFEAVPASGIVTTSRGEMPLAALEKRTGCTDTSSEWNCWVEYRPVGEDEIVQRSAHTKLKTPPAPIYVSAGRVA